MGANFGADAVLQRGNDFAARGVVLGICGEDEQDVERKAQRVALNLNVALLHDVEQADLDFAREVGKFVDGEDAAIRARKQAVMDGQFVGKIAAAASGADGIDVADDIGHGDVRSGELFDVALIARHPGDRRVIAFGGDFLAASAANGAQRVVVDFAAGDDGDLRVEKLRQSAEDAALRLAAKPKKNEIVAGEQRVDNLRDDGVFVAMHAGKERLVFFDHAQKVLAHFVLHGARKRAGVEVRDAFEFAERASFRMR